MEMAISKTSYQRTIPIFIIAVVAGLFIVEYFLVPIDALAQVKDEFLAWGVTMSTVAIIFGQVMLLTRYLRLLSSARKSGATVNLLDSVVFFAAFLIFGIVGLSDPQTTSGPTFTILYMTFVMKYAQGVGSTGWPAQVNAVFRVFKITSLETLTIAAVYIIVWLRYLTLVSFYIPGIFEVENYIKLVIHPSAQRAGLIGSAVGALIIGVRALVGREPGLMEYEVT